jgi:protein tyrosine/serine phosphatase
VVACIRRAQEWSYVSILAEFRQFTWPHKLFDFEQVFEVYHTDGLKQNAAVRDFFAINENFKVSTARSLHQLP